MKKRYFLIILVLLLSSIVWISVSYADETDTAVQATEQQEQAVSSNNVGLWDFLNENSGGITAVATVFYLGATIAIFLSSRSQEKQSQIHHCQNIGFQLLEKRTSALALVVDDKYDELVLPSVGFLFDRGVYNKLLALQKANSLMNNARFCAFQSLESLEKVNRGLYTSYMAYLSSVLTITSQGEIEKLYCVLDKILKLLPKDCEKSKLLDSFTKETVNQSREILNIKSEIIMQMEKYISDSIN